MGRCSMSKTRQTLDTLTEAQREKYLIFEASLAPLIQIDGSDQLSAGQHRPLCAAIERERRLQYRFVVLYQALVLVLAIAALALLIWSFFTLMNAEVLSLSDVEVIKGVLTTAGGALSGGVAIFLLAQRKDARDTYQAVIASFKANGCDASK